MPIIVQFEFAFDGPFGNDLLAAAEGLAKSIANEPGLLWKIWIEDPTRRKSGGVYLFKDRPSADAYITMHSARLSQFGVSNPRVGVFDVNVPLSNLTRGPLA
jgi:hypothetical protein